MAIATAIPEAPTRKWQFEMVRVDDLKVDHTYHHQARFNEKRAQGIAAAFDMHHAGTITIVERTDGTRWIVDGQHRVAAARMAGVEVLPARVFRGLTQEQEAGMFVGLSAAVALKAEYKWTARAAAGDPVVLDIIAVLNGYGVRIAGGGNSPSPTSCWATTALESIHKVGELHRTIRTLRTAWPVDDAALSASALYGVASFLQVYANKAPHPRFDEPRLAASLATIPARGLVRIIAESRAVRSVTSGGSGGGINAKGAEREAVLAVYNRRLRHPLPSATASDLKRIFLGRNPWLGED